MLIFQGEAGELARLIVPYQVKQGIFARLVKDGAAKTSAEAAFEPGSLGKHVRLFEVQIDVVAFSRH